MFSLHSNFFNSFILIYEIKICEHTCANQVDCVMVFGLHDKNATQKTTGTISNTHTTKHYTGGTTNIH